MNQIGEAVEDSHRTGLLSVAFVSPGWPPDAFANGIIPYVANIAEEMRRAGHRATIVAERTLGVVEGDVRDAHPSRKPSNLAIRAVDYLAYRASSDLGERRQATRALIAECRRLIAENGLQLVEMEESHGRVLWIKKALPIPVVVRLHGPWFLNGPLRGAPDDAAFRRRVAVEKQAILAADAITTPSHDVLERTRAFYGLALEKAMVIPNPTSMIPREDRWRPDGCEPETIVFVGRFDRHKGGDLVIGAFGEVARHRPGARLVFAGPDSGFFDEAGRRITIGEYLRDHLSVEVAGRVQWLGPQPAGSLAALRRKGAVVVFGSRYDNFPIAVLEAMAVGSPLVAPRIGGIPEIVVDNVNGLLYEAGDSGDMAAKLGRLLEDRELATRLGWQAGLDCENRYQPALLAREIADFFREVIGADGNRDRERSPR